ncbi:MAG: Oligopeptide transport system permease protein OppC [Puniceicoccaceae bacterium MED-G32]|nr:MAG: Oligopeptide transport system permease protein OppC [Puniceicoccaceae bacterium MED-G32]
MINSKTEKMHLSRSAGSEQTKLWETLYRSTNARIGFALFFTIALACFIGPFFVPHSYETTRLSLGASAPSSQHLFGTDVLGRDLLIRTLIGGQISIFVGFLATIVALIIGTAYGMVAGYIGKKTDALMMRFVDTLYALPFTIMVILLTVLFGRSLVLIFLAIGAVEWLTLARIVRGETRNIKTQAYVQAAQLNGLPHRQIISKHILRNLISPVIVFATLTIPSVILLESVISFLGLGVQAPLASWGSLINEGAQKFDVYPWLLIFPSIFFSMTILSLNFIGDAFRDAFDPIL